MKKLIAIIIIVVGLAPYCIGIADVSSGYFVELRNMTDDSYGYSNYLNDYIYENDISLDNYDIQYNMANNLNNSFILTGYAELDDYYNYGYRNLESECFCINITPESGSYSDRWYIYINRDGTERLFEYLLDNGRIYIETVCYISSDFFQKNQGCMAFAEYMVWGAEN